MKTQELATQKGKVAALAALSLRRKGNAGKVRKRNDQYPAGHPMYFYCVSCGDDSDCLAESYTGIPKKLCGECQALKDCGWLE